MSKKIVCALLAFVLLIGLMPVSAIPASAAEKGSCGANLTWEVTGSTLAIKGEGSMELSGGAAPWKSHINDIITVRFELTKPISIAVGAFTDNYPKLKVVEVNNLAHWAESAFNGNNPLSNGGKAHNLHVKNADGIYAYVSNAEIPGGTSFISDGAFKGATISGVTVPGTVDKIGASAFESCINLNRVDIHNGVRTIGAKAFAGCTALTSVKLPYELKNLGTAAFQNCTSLTTVNGDCVLTEMGEGVFMNCEKLSVVSLPSQLKSIPNYTFSGCDALTNINLPGKVEKIGTHAFYNCPLNSIALPESVKTIASDAYAGCTKLQGIYVKTLHSWLNMDIQGANPLVTAKHLYVDNDLVTTLTIPGDVQNVPSERFANCRDIVKVIIPNSVRVIGSRAFAGCENLKEVEIGNSLHTISQDAFAGCPKISSVTVDEAQWTSRMTRESGNTDLEKGYNLSHKAPVNPDGPLGTKFTDISDNLVNLAAGMRTFRREAYEFPANSGKYLIGYGTPSKKGAVISEAEAKLMLKEENLAIAAGSVVYAFPTLNTEANRAKREALTSYTFRNGFDWLNNASHPLNKAAKNSSITEFAFLEAICYGTEAGTAEFMNRLCDGNLYVNGKYSNAVPANYGYVKLDPNGGVAAGGVFAIYDKNAATSKLSDTYNPTQYHQKFLGWFTQKENGKLISYLDDSLHGRTLYAHWQHDESGVPDVKKVSYDLPTVMVNDSCVDASGRVVVHKDPSTASQHIQTIENNTLMSIVAEYRDAAGDLWVQIKNSGWVSLGNIPMGAVEHGTVTLGKNQRLNVFESTTSSNKVASLRNGNMVSIVARQEVDKKPWGKVWFLDHETNTYKQGWVDLTHVAIDKNHDTEDNGDGRTPIAKGVVSGTDNVNVRGTPNVYGAFYCKLPRGRQVKIYDKTTTNGVDWALIDEGWVCMQYIQVVKDPETVKPGEETDNSGNAGSDSNTTPLAKGQVIGNLVLNVRSAPGAQNKKVATLTGGTRLSIFQTKMYNGAQWGRMEKGWVCMTYIKLDGDVILGGGSDSSNENQKPGTLGQARVVNCSTHVNVRASATPQSALQGTYSLGSVIDVFEKTENNGFDWYRTEKGWVCGTYLQEINSSNTITPVVPNPGTPVIPNPGAPVTNTVGTITGSNNVNVREQPGVYNAKVTTLRSGSRVNIKGSKVVDGATWYQIDQGWVAGQYVLVGGGEITNSNGAPVIGGTTETTNGKFATGTIAQAGTAVRAGAGYGYKEVKKLALGDKVTVYEQQLLDGVAWGRISNTDWVNLAFVTLDSTGITGTGTVGVIARCGHAVNVRRTPSVDSARMATLILGATVEVLETKDLGNGEIWGRTPQGWVNMHYVQVTGDIPAPPLNPETNLPNNPVPNPAPETEKPQPADRGIPFDMKGSTNAETDLQIIPGVLGEYDAKIGDAQKVTITKLDSVDDVMWGLVEGGWINMKYVDLSNYVVSNAAQIIWKDASTTTAVGAINKGDVKNIQELKMDEAKKVWGKIADDQWIELTQITALGNYSTSFIVKTTTTAATKVYTYSDKTSEVALEELPAGTAITITALSYDTSISGKTIMAKIDTGWIEVSAVALPINAQVTPELLVTWDSAERVTPVGFKHCGDTVSISEFGLKSTGVPMGKIGTGEWVELAAIVTP